MPRYLVERSFPEGLAIPIDDGGAKTCQVVVDGNASEGVTWVHSYVTTDKRTTFASTTAPAPRPSAGPPRPTSCPSTASPRSGSWTRTSTADPRRNDATDHRRRAQRGPAHHRLDVPRRGGRVHPHGGSDQAGGRQHRRADQRARPERGIRRANSARPVDAGGDLAAQLARARLATGKYATNLRAAKADGYQIITRMIPDMGWHFLNPAIQGFDVTKPHILVYERNGRRWQLGALEWVFPQQPEVPLLPGAAYGSFAAACHYKDGTFTFARVQELCAKRSPETGARFNFWHPDLVTLHVWVWYHNPDGLYSGTNPLIRPFNRG